MRNNQPNQECKGKMLQWERKQMNKQRSGGHLLYVYMQKKKKEMSCWLYLATHDFMPMLILLAMQTRMA